MRNSVLWIVALGFLVPVFAARAVPAQEAKDTKSGPIEIAEVKREGPVSFDKDVVEILELNCIACHNVAVSENGLSLEDPASIRKGGKSGPAVVPGNSGESLLLKMASHRKEPFMPPADNVVDAKPLTPEQLGILKLWIDQGAKGEAGSEADAVEWQPLPTGVNPIYCVALTPDKQYVACGRANQIFIYRVPTGELVTRLTDPSLLETSIYDRPGVAHLDIVQALAFSPDGLTLASSGFRTVKFWQRPVPTPIQNFTESPDEVPTLALSPDQSLLAAGGKDGVVRLLDLAAGKLVRSLEGHRTAVTAVAFTPDGSRLLSSSSDGDVRMWNVSEGAMVSRLGSPSAINDLAVNADASLVATAGADHRVRLWNLPAAPETLAQLGAAINAAVVSPDGKTLAVVGDDQTVRLFELATGKEIKTLEGPTSGIASIAFADSGSRLVAGGGDGTVQVWDLASGTSLGTLAGTGAAASAVDLNPANPAQVLVGSSDGVVKLLRLELPPARTLNGSIGSPARVLARSPDGTLLALAGGSGAITLWDVASGNLVRVLAEHTAAVTALAFSSDGSELASAGEDHTARVWNVADGKPLARFAGHQQTVTSVAFTADGAQIVSGAADSTVKLWNVSDASERMTFYGHTAAVTGVAVTPAGQVVSASLDGTIRIWEATSGQQVRSLDQGSPVTKMALSPDGSRLVSAGGDNVLKLWNTADGSQTASLGGHEGEIASVAFSPDGLRIVSAGKAGLAFVWDTATGSKLEHLSGASDPVVAALFGRDASDVALARNDASVELVPLRTVQTYRGHTGAITAARFTQDGARILTSSLDGTVRGFDVASGSQAFVANHGAPVNGLALRPDGAVMASAGDDHRVKLWNTSDGSAVEGGSFEGHTAAICTVAFSQDGSRLISGDAAGTVLVRSADGEATEAFRGDGGAVLAAVGVDPAASAIQSVASDGVLRRWSLAQVATLAGHEATVQSVAFLPDGSRLASGSADKTIRIWNVAERKQERSLNHGAAVNAVSINADGKRLASGGDDNTAKVWNLEDGSQVAVLEGHGAPIRDVAFSADGAHIVTAAADNTMRTWNAANGAAENTLTGHTAPVLAAAFLHGAERIVSASADKSVKVWELTPPWQLVRTIGGPDDPSQFIDRVISLDFSPDGKLLATGGGEPSRTGELKLWNVADGTLFREIADAHSDTVFGIDFSPDGKLLASCAADKFVKVFEVETGKLTKSFEGHTHHVLGVSWKADGKVLASCGADAVIKVWNYETGEQQRTISGFGKEVTSITFVGDTQNTLSSSGDKTVRMHRVDNGQNFRNFGGGSDFMFSVSASPDGKLVIAGGQDSVLRLWDGENGKSLLNIEPPQTPQVAAQQAAK